MSGGGGGRQEERHRVWDNVPWYWSCITCHGSGHAAFRFVPFAVERCNYCGQICMYMWKRLLSRLCEPVTQFGDVAMASGHSIVFRRSPEGAFLHASSAKCWVAASMHQGTAERNEKSEHVISRDDGSSFVPT